MTRLFDFSLLRHGLEKVRFLVQRPELPCNGDLESAFLEGMKSLHRYPVGASLAAALRDVSESSDMIVVIRNADLVLDSDLPMRIASTIARAKSLGDWALAGAGGLGVMDQRHLALYASEEPAIPENAGLQPLIDLMPDIYVVNASYVRTLDREFFSRLDQALEPALAVQGYLDGVVSIFSPELTAGINGGLLTRDFVQLSTELSQRFSGKLVEHSINTLSGPVRVNGDVNAGKATGTTVDLHQAIEAAISKHSEAPSLTIITRTRFERMHLLRRMLTSISRARRDEMALEIVLSTDAKPELAEATFKTLQKDFVNLKLRLKLNPPAGHSRVTNLVAGVQIATGEYLMFLDDDDYLDLFAFDTMRSATFAGNRPVIALSSNVHEETWEETPSGRWILSHSAHMSTYSAASWRDMFQGVNKLPICGLVFTRTRLRARLKSFRLQHDLSEDYALFLLMLTDPELPAIFECAEPAVHISLRGTENSVLMVDRRPWVQDITRFLTDLTQSTSVTAAGHWEMLTRSGNISARNSELTTSTDMHSLLERRSDEIRLLQKEVHRLRAMNPMAKEKAA